MAIFPLLTLSLSLPYLLLYTYPSLLALDEVKLLPFRTP